MAQRAREAFRLGLALCVAGAWGISVGCSSSGPFDEPLTLGDGTTVSADVLNEGRQAYRHYCRSCHGEAGDGTGPASAVMRPQPRDFRAGLFKFGWGPAGSLPTDAALDRIIRRGLHGTPMRPWDLEVEERHAIIQFLKTFSPRWTEEAPEDEIELALDPWTGREAAARERGEAVYHLTAADHAGCATCHPGYVTREALARLFETRAGWVPEQFSEELHRSTARETEYPVVAWEGGGIVETADGEEVYAKQLPPDFLFHRVKTAPPQGSRVDGVPYTARAQREDLYRTIASGIGGAAMPQWKGALSEESLWALVYYVQSLMELRGTRAALELRARLEADRSDPERGAHERQEPEPSRSSRGDGAHEHGAHE